MNDGSAENWQPVLGAPGYEVSDHGRVRSIDRVLIDSWGRAQRRRGKLLKPIKNQSRGHLMVSISSTGRRRMIHHLVLEAFVGPRPDGMDGLHWDDDKTNNALSNLRWDTPSANMYDRIRNGRHRQAAQTRCIRGHLLVSPNLTQAGIRQGKRGCLACGRAQTLTAKRRSQCVVFLIGMQELSDSYYADIMAQERAA